MTHSSKGLGQEGANINGSGAGNKSTTGHHCLDGPEKKDTANARARNKAMRVESQ